MKYAFLIILAVSTSAFAQSGNGTAVYRTQDTGMGAFAWSFGTASRAPVLNEPYSAKIAIETIQTLPDGNRIVHHTLATFARDSQGRTRREIPSPMPVAKAPRIVLIHDPATQTTYELNLNDKTARKITSSFPATGIESGSGGKKEAHVFFIPNGNVPTAGPVLPYAVSASNVSPTKENVSTESLGSRTMEGFLVNGTRTTRTIPAGKIGNSKPITIVTETWESPDLQAVVYRKRIDPLNGEEIYQLTDIDRAEPDPSLFQIPADFKTIEDAQGPVVIRSGEARN